MPGSSHEPGLGWVSIHLVCGACGGSQPCVSWAGPGIRGQDDVGLARWLPADHVDLGHRHMALETLLSELGLTLSST